jgi:hypothetical protein
MSKSAKQGGNVPMNPVTLQDRLEAIQSTWSQRERRLRAEEARRRTRQLLRLLARPLQATRESRPLTYRSHRPAI